MKEDKYRAKDHAYLIYEIQKCQDHLRNKTKITDCVGGEEEGEQEDCEVDPKCASEGEIRTWLEKKKAVFKVINNQVNLEYGKAGDII